MEAVRATGLIGEGFALGELGKLAWALTNCAPATNKKIAMITFFMVVIFKMSLFLVFVNYLFRVF